MFVRDKNMKKIFGKNKGFTLFEMLVVISIIGIILGLISTSFSAAQKRARDSRRVQDLNGMQKAMEQYFALCSAYPGTLFGGGDPYADAWNSVAQPAGGLITPASCGTQTILTRWPSDPGINISGIYNYFTPAATWTTAVYCICTNMEVANASLQNSNATCTGAGTSYCVKNAQ